MAQGRFWRVGKIGQETLAGENENFIPRLLHSVQSGIITLIHAEKMCSSFLLQAHDNGKNDDNKGAGKK